jgi:hypothetical protein
MGIKSFFLSRISNDEYVDKKKLQFRLEALYIIIILLAINVLIGVLTGDYSEHVILSAGILFFFVIYTLLRSIFTGLEYPEVAGKRAYKTKRHEVLVYAGVAGIIFLVINIGDKLFFNTDKSWVDIIVISIIFIMVFFVLNYISVRMSYQKNKDIGDDK